MKSKTKHEANHSNSHADGLQSAQYDESTIEVLFMARGCASTPALRCVGFPQTEKLTANQKKRIILDKFSHLEDVVNNLWITYG